MENKENDSKKKDQRTPIIDGDARPDMNIHGEDKEQRQDHPVEIPGKKKEGTTKNRDDKNSLEDYKDAMLD